MHPFDVQHEVLVHPVAAHDADGLAGGHEHAVLDHPGVRGGVDVGPAGEVLAVEQGHPLGPWLGGRDERNEGAAAGKQEGTHGWRTLYSRRHWRAEHRRTGARRTEDGAGRQESRIAGRRSVEDEPTMHIDTRRTRRAFPRCRRGAAAAAGPAGSPRRRRWCRACRRASRRAATCTRSTSRSPRATMTLEQVHRVLRRDRLRRRRPDRLLLQGLPGGALRRRHPPHQAARLQPRARHQRHRRAQRLRRAGRRASVMPTWRS